MNKWDSIKTLKYYMYILFLVFNCFIWLDFLVENKPNVLEK